MTAKASSPMGEWRCLGKELIVSNDYVHYRTKLHNWGSMNPEDVYMQPILVIDGNVL